MTLFEKIRWYYRTHGGSALLRRCLQKALGRQPNHPPPTGPAALIPASPNETHPLPSPESSLRDAVSVVRDRFPSLQPLPVYASPGPGPRVNLITDSISSGSLFGGVATAIVLAALLAKRDGAKLRVITRLDDPKSAPLARILRCNGIECDSNIEFVRVPVGDPAAQIDLSPMDIFITTSWWTTESVLGSVPVDRVHYLLQEDERMFYPYGDEWLRCSELLSRRDLRYIVNTELLRRHLCRSGLEHMESNAISFEPAFPQQMFHHVPRNSEGKRILFFYSRPKNDRNLFYRGLEALDRAVAGGVFDPDAWEIIFAGHDIEPVQLGGLINPRSLGVMNWQKYGDFVRSVDLGFCLMATPHPSYPPLDLAACGATVVTNQFGLKTDLSLYSENISCVGADISSLVSGLRKAEIDARDDSRRMEKYMRHGIQRSWVRALEDVVETMRSEN